MFNHGQTEGNNDLPEPGDVYSLLKQVCSPSEIFLTHRTIALFLMRQVSLPVRRLVLSENTEFSSDYFRGLPCLTEIVPGKNKIYKWTGTYLYRETSQMREILVFRKDRPINVSITVDRDIVIKAHALENCRYISLLCFEKPNDRAAGAVPPRVIMEPHSVGSTRVVKVCVSGFVTDEEAAQIFHNDAAATEVDDNAGKIEWLMKRDGFVGAFDAEALKEACISLYPKEIQYHGDNFGISETVGDYEPITFPSDEHTSVMTPAKEALIERIKDEIARLQSAGVTFGNDTMYKPCLCKEDKMTIERVMDAYGRVLIRKEITGSFDVEAVSGVLKTWQSMAHNMLYLMDIVKMEVENDRVVLLADNVRESLGDVLNEYWNGNMDAVEKIRMALFAMFFVIWRLMHHVLGSYISHKMLTPGNVFFTETENQVTTGFYCLADDEIACSKSDLKYLHPRILKRMKVEDLVRYFGAQDSFKEFDVPDTECADADMWSLGILLYELARKQPIPEIQTIEDFYNHISKWESVSQNAEFQEQLKHFSPDLRMILETLLRNEAELSVRDAIKLVESIEPLLLGTRNKTDATYIEKIFDPECKKDEKFAQFMKKGMCAVERTRGRVPVYFDTQ